MSRGESGVRTENSKGGTVLECVALGYAIAVCQIVEAATRVVKWSVVKRNPSVKLPFKQDSSQQQISAEQVGRSARGVRYLQATAELDRQDQDRPSCTACAETSDERQGGRGPKHDPSPLDREDDAAGKKLPTSP